MEAIRRVLAIDIPQIVVLPEDAVAMVGGSNGCSVTHVANVVREGRKQNSYPRPQLATSFVAASNELERKIAAIWQEVLGIDQVGVHDDFFELGGNSLVGLQIVARINRTLDLSVELRAVFELPTVASQAQMIGVAQQLGSDELAAPDADMIDVLV
jgi:acyl carrier protein